MGKIPAHKKQYIILSLFDESGFWSEPYRKAGYVVLQIDLKLGIDILKWDYKQIPVNRVRGILAAPPCTHIAGSGAQYWKAKDRDGRTKEAIILLKKTLEIVRWFNPVFWAIENPVGRMNKILPEMASFGPWYFDPYEFGDPYTKKTGLWGKFRKPFKTPVKPKKATKHGSWIMSLGGSSEKTKELRSFTPKGFSLAFFKANK